MSLDLTVAIPTYNGESRLPKVIEHLQNQQGIENLNWEILVVDNNSKDATAQLVHNYQANWNHPYLLKYLSEIQQGAAFARAKAIQEAQSEIICFLDDDNLPAQNWVIEAYKFAINNPQAGAIASRISGKFEVNPPENIKPIIFYLAITERGEYPHLFQPRKQGFPPTAGLVVRRQAWQDNVPKKPFFVGRVGSSMLGSEDAEALCYIQKAGWEIWYNPAMKIEHLIPTSRLERNYLISLMQAVGLACHHLRMLILPTWQRPLAFFAYLINDLRKFTLYYVRYHNLINSDILIACEMERLRSRMISPFYLETLKIRRFFQKFIT